MSRNEKMPALPAECYAGQRAEESPRRFLIGLRKIEQLGLIV